MIYALDTNTLIYFFKDVGNVAETLLNTPPIEVAVPAVVLVTHNTDEFTRVSGLRVIDWY